MILLRSAPSRLASLFLLAASLATTVSAGDVLETNGFSTCLNTDQIVVERMNIKYDRSIGTVRFDVAGTSKSVQKVRAVLKVEAYGREVYRNEFNPCDKEKDTYIEQLCPSRFAWGRLGSETEQNADIWFCSPRGKICGR